VQLRTTKDENACIASGIRGMLVAMAGLRAKYSWCREPEE